MSAIVVDTSDWALLRVTGSDRVRFLQGLTTINIQTLAPGVPSWGAILTPKGRVLSVIAAELDPTGAEPDGAILVRCEAALADKTLAILEKYAVMDDVAFAASTPPSHRVWDDAASVWTAPFVAGAAGVAASDNAREALRIRAGLVRYGVDVDEDHFPFETPLAAFLDYGKGCYVGQEPVFRVHAQGNAARQLRGLVIAGTEPVASGARIAHPARDAAGTITSAAPSADGTSWVALGYLHRTVWEPGGQVTIADAAGPRPATVHALPF